MQHVWQDLQLIVLAKIYREFRTTALPVSTTKHNMFLVSETTLHRRVLEAPAVKSNPSSVLTVLWDPQNWGFFLDGKDNVGRQLCCGGCQMYV